MLLAIFLALLQATPHVNPEATPVPKSIVTNTPWFMYEWWFWLPLLVVIAFGARAVYKLATRKPGHMDSSGAVTPAETVKKTNK